MSEYSSKESDFKRTSEGQSKSTIISDLESRHLKNAQTGKGERGNVLAQYSEEDVMQMGRDYEQSMD